MLRARLCAFAIFASLRELLLYNSLRFSWLMVLVLFGGFIYIPHVHLAYF